MTFRLPISVKKVKWYDGQQVDETDLETEQSYNSQSHGAILNNFFGSGLIPYVPERTYLFDSTVLTAEQSQLIAANNFDGYGIVINAYPTDTSLGAQLEVELSGSNVFARHTLKVLVLGTDFEGTLQYEKFTFARNEIQVGTKHFSKIIALMFENFKGNNNCSRNQGGRVVIREALPMQVSRSTLMASQNYEPDIFFRDFKVYTLATPIPWPNVTVALKQTIQNAIGPSYSVTTLNIKQTGLIKRKIEINDLATIYGEKFQAKSDNIQKVTLLLGVEKDTTTTEEHWFDWTGDLLISIYPLQTSVNCITDIIPENAIDFPPEATPIAQLTISQSELKSQGFVLNEVEQPVDFIFTNSRIAGNVNSGITVDNYYMVTIQRTGAADTGTIFTWGGTSRSTYNKFSFFNGVAWTDVPDEDMWFEIWSDAVKVADGMGVDNGNGMFIPKTDIDSSGVTYDYSLKNISLINNGQNVTNYTVAQAVDESMDLVQHPKTGNSVYSRELTVASVSNISSSSFTTLKESSDPVMLGCSTDRNNKVDLSVSGTDGYIGFAKNNKFTIISPDANLLNSNLIGSKLIPNIANPTAIYRIYDVILCTDGYGDVNGDGYIDAQDVTRCAALLGHGLASSITQAMIVAGAITAEEILRADVDGDGYITANDYNLINDYVNHVTDSFAIGYTFNRLCLYVAHNVGRNDGYYDCSETFIRENPFSTTLIPVATLSQYSLEYYGRPDAVVIDNDSAFTTVPFVAVDYLIVNKNDWWAEELLKVNNTGRLLPCTFTYTDSITENDCDIKNEFRCEERFTEPLCGGGRNDFYVPGNLIMGQGQIIGVSGSHHPIDFEMNTITLNVSDTLYNNGSIDIFGLFVADRGDGFTRIHRPAMKFADCSFVPGDAVTNNQVRFSVAIQAFSPNLDGYTATDGYGIIVDPIIGINMLNATGVLHFKTANLYNDPNNVLRRTKIQVTVYLKKAGWKNTPIEIDYSIFDNLVGI